MADDGSAQSGANWPLPKFRFEVQFGNEYGEASFQEVSGLGSESRVIEYRGANSNGFSTIKMPGLAKFGNVTMKKGVFANDNRFWDWYNLIKMNNIKRTTVVIKLLDESGSIIMQWQLTNAFPSKISGNNLKPGSNEVAVETIEIAHEGLVVSPAP